MRKPRRKRLYAVGMQGRGPVGQLVEAGTAWVRRARQQSEQYTGRSVRGANGTWPGWPQLEQTMSCMLCARAAAALGFGAVVGNRGSAGAMKQALLRVNSCPRRSTRKDCRTRGKPCLCRSNAIAICALPREILCRPVRASLGDCGETEAFGDRVFGRQSPSWAAFAGSMHPRMTSGVARAPGGCPAAAQVREVSVETSSFTLGRDAGFRC